MKSLVTGATIGVLLVVFVFAWIYLASQGRVPVIHAPLEWVSTPVRIVALLVLAAIVGVVYFTIFPAKKRPS
jgi:heme/copper-type cytochrome/quinol oxidase subunit 2